MVSTGKNRKFLCQCGQRVSVNGRAAHYRTQVHKRFMEMLENQGGQNPKKARLDLAPLTQGEYRPPKSLKVPESLANLGITELFPGFIYGITGPKRLT